MSEKQIMALCERLRKRWESVHRRFHIAEKDFHEKNKFFIENHGNNDEQLAFVKLKVETVYEKKCRVQESNLRPTSRSRIR